MAKIFKSQVKDLKSRFKFGIEVPRGVKEAMMLDKKNGDNKWMEAISKEKNQLFDFETFEVLGKGKKAFKVCGSPVSTFLTLNTTCVGKQDSLREAI